MASATAEDVARDMEQKIIARDAKAVITDETKQEVKNIAQKAWQFVKDNPKTTLTAAAIGLYMLDHNIADPASALAKMLRDVGGGAGAGLDSILASLKKYGLYMLLGLGVLLIMFIIFNLVSALSTKKNN
jgi:hypothetical protein